MSSVHDLAKYILAKLGEMTAIKLQKLVYYAQVWSIAEGDPIFSDTIKAWQEGPVVPALFHAHKGRRKVTPSDIGGDGEALPPWQRARVDRVLAFYGKFTATYLSDLSHHERPWAEARFTGESHGRESQAISNEAIRNFYVGKTPEGLDEDYKLQVAKELMERHRAALARLAQ